MIDVTINFNPQSEWRCQQAVPDLDVGQEKSNLSENLMIKYIFSPLIVIIGLAILFLQSYWVRQNISNDFTHTEYGVPAYVIVEEDGARSETTVQAENLFIYFVIAMSFGFLAGRLWPRKCNQNGQQAAPLNP